MVLQTPICEMQVTTFPDSQHVQSNHPKGPHTFHTHITQTIRHYSHLFSFTLKIPIRAAHHFSLPYFIIR